MLRRFLDPNPATRLGTDVGEVHGHSAWTRVSDELGGAPAAATGSPWEVQDPAYCTRNPRPTAQSGDFVGPACMLADVPIPLPTTPSGCTQEPDATAVQVGPGCDGALPFMEHAHG